VPGILGTKLAVSDSNVWLSHRSIANALGPAFFPIATNDTNAWNTFGSMAYPSYGTKADTLVPGAIFGLDNDVPTDPNSLSCDAPPESFLKLFGTCQSDLFTYKSLFTDLQNGGYSPQAFPYDWRRDVRDVAVDLYDKVASMYNASPARPVTI